MTDFEDNSFNYSKVYKTYLKETFTCLSNLLELKYLKYIDTSQVDLHYLLRYALVINYILFVEKKLNREENCCLLGSMIVSLKQSIFNDKDKELVYDDILYIFYILDKLSNPIKRFFNNEKNLFSSDEKLDSNQMYI